MGNAKLRKAAQADLKVKLEPAVIRVATAVRKLATAASSHIGSDCYVHAALGAQLLLDQGFDAKPVCGYAAWRLGPGDGDVLSHTSKVKGYLPPGAKGFAYHYWIECGDFVIDLTTYQFKQKAADLDAMDGGHTTVAWTPDFLFLPRTALKSYEAVAKAPDGGVAYYEARPELSLIAEATPLDPEDLAAARIIVSNPDMVVVGPNDL